MNSAARILVPVDGSAASLRALEHAGTRQQADKCVSLLVLNVQVPLPPNRFLNQSMLKEHHARVAAAALDRARVIVKRLKLKAPFRIRSGDPARTIVKVARAEHCSEIVMGTHGRGRFAASLLGSVAMKVVHLATIPITLVK